MSDHLVDDELQKLVDKAFDPAVPPIKGKEIKIGETTFLVQTNLTLTVNNLPESAVRAQRDPEPSEFMDTAEVAELLGVSVKTIRRWVALGNVFPFVPLPGAGHDYRFLRASVMEWARKRELGNRE